MNRWFAGYQQAQLSSTYVCVDHFLKFWSWHQTYLGFHDLTPFEHQNGGEHRDSIFCGQRHILIYIHFGHFGFAFVRIGKFVNNWTQFSTRTSRRGPEIDQNRRARLQHLSLKSIFIQFKSHFFTTHQWLRVSNGESVGF